MGLLIELLVVLIVLAIAAYAAWWICQKFQLPPPILWLVGAVLLIGLLIFVARVMGGGGPLFVR